VKFSPAANASQRAAALASRGASRIRAFGAVDIDHVRLPPGLSVAAALAAFRSMPGVVAVQPNYIRRAIQSAPPDDPYWIDGSLWGLSKIQAPSAWSNFTSGDGSVVIASIDTGVSYDHPDLSANMWRNPFEVPGNGLDDDGNGYVDDVFGIDAVNHDSDPMDDQGHGTHTSGTFAAVGNNGLGVVGVNWNARVLACKFLSASGYGDDAGAIECFNYIVALKNRGVNIRVSSNSWGGPRETPPATALQAAIDAAGTAGILNVFGAGNDGSDNDVTPFDPASFSLPSIVAVASSGQTDRRSSFCNYGATTVDLAAPGENILSTYLAGDYTYLSGTSMATPHVAGAAALLARLDPGLSVAALKSLLLDNVDRSQRWNGVVASGGRLNVYKAASAVGTGVPNAPPTVSIVSPGDGASYIAPASIAIAADASDSDGTVQYVSFFVNGALIGTDAASPYGLTWNNVSPGNYTLTAVATDNLGSIGTSAAVHVVVPANVAPSVSLTDPADGMTFTAPVTITLNATAGDSDGSVQQVMFYANGTLLGSDATSPYSLTWNAPMGSYTLTATAVDNLGAAGTSAVARVVVNPIPGRVNVALASNGGIPSASSTYNANYPASGATNGDRKGLNWGAGGGWNDGTQNAGPDWLEVDFNGPKLIEEVDVFSMQDNYSAPVEPTPTLTFTSWGLRAFEVQYWDGANWLPVPGGAVSANNLVWRQFVFAALTTSRIRVYVTGALNGYSRIMEVEAWGIADGSNTPPTVSMASPAEGAAFTAPANITIDADANDPDGNIQQVAFYANGTPIGTDVASPYSITWSGVAAGAYTLTAVATDNAGATSTSTAVHVTVASNVPPSVSITSPAESATFGAPAAISVSATAADADGTVASVTFYANGASIGADTTAPYSLSWTNVPAGAYTLTAIAADNLGATTTSAPVHVTVTQPSNRTNFALPANGGMASASSTYNANYLPAGAINGDRKGLNFGAGGGWNDGTPNASPDWLQIDFSAPRTIDEIDVFSMQDNYSAPVDPTPTMTFTTWGLRAFDVQYWNGSAWVTAGSITGNNLVWRQFLFAPVTTSKVRVYITAALNGYSRVMEMEAWGASGGGGTPPPPPPGRINMALSSNGGVASASSTYSGNYPASGANNGDRRGLNWGAGGGWNDGTPNASPDWIEIDFNGSKSIDEVDVFSMQDNYSAPSDPTPTMTFTSWGLRAFEVQYWNGSSWVSVPGASVTGNNLVWRQFIFSAVTTTKIRVYITAALNGYSRVMEVEAWGVGAALAESQAIGSFPPDAKDCCRIAAAPSMPPMPIDSTALLGINIKAPFSFRPSYSMFIARRWSAVGLS
jgi:subtilisin family serine protease